MKTIEKLKDYIENVLQLRIVLQPWPFETELPYFLKQSCSFHFGRLLESQVVLMMDKRSEQLTPARIQKNHDYLVQRYPETFIYVTDSISSYNRNRLITRKIPFIVPGNQLYIPMIGIDLREYFKSQISTPQQLSPATQVLFIYLMRHHTDTETTTPSHLAEVLGFSRMTLTRAFSELESAGLFGITTKGREKSIVFNADPRQTWMHAQSFLRNPVRENRRITKSPAVPPAVWAGLSALSRYSSLAEPDTPAVALSQDQWRSHLRQQPDHRIYETPDIEFIVEIWRYDPGIVSEKDIVDPLSLYLSLKETTDERIEIALEELMESIKW